MTLNKIKKFFGTMVLTVTIGTAAIMPVMAYTNPIPAFTLTSSTNVKSNGIIPISKKISTSVHFSNISKQGYFYIGFNKMKNGKYQPFETKTISTNSSAFAYMRTFTLEKNKMFQEFIIGATATGNVKEVRFQNL